MRVDVRPHGPHDAERARRVQYQEEHLSFGRTPGGVCSVFDDGLRRRFRSARRPRRAAGRTGRSTLCAGRALLFAAQFFARVPPFGGHEVEQRPGRAEHMTPEAVEEETGDQRDKQQVPVEILAVEAEDRAEGLIAAAGRIEEEKTDEQGDEQEHESQGAQYFQERPGGQIDAADLVRQFLQAAEGADKGAVDVFAQDKSRPPPPSPQRIRNKLLMNLFSLFLWLQVDKIYLQNNVYCLSSILLNLSPGKM